MLNGLCATGGFNTADIVVLAILGLSVLFGVVLGFAKMLRGGLGTLIAVAVGVVCAVFLAEMVSNLSFMNDLKNTIGGKMTGFASSLGLNAKVEDKAIFVLSGDNWYKITDLFREGINAKIVQAAQPVLIALVGGALNGSVSIAAAVSALTVKIIGGIAVFVIAVIVAEILIGLLSKLFSSIISKQKVFRVFDCALGLVFSAAAAVVIVFAVFFVVDKLNAGGNAAAFVDIIKSSSVAKWFYENNPFVLLLK